MTTARRLSAVVQACPGVAGLQAGCDGLGAEQQEQQADDGRQANADDAHHGTS
jgi:hypothetical protein